MHGRRSLHPDVHLKCSSKILLIITLVMSMTCGTTSKYLDRNASVRIDFIYEKYVSKIPWDFQN